MTVPSFSQPLRHRSVLKLLAGVALFRILSLPGLFSGDASFAQWIGLLAVFAIVALVIAMASRAFGRTYGHAAGLMLLGMPLFFYSPLLPVDTALFALGIAMAMTGVWSAVEQRCWKWAAAAIVGTALAFYAEAWLSLQIVLPPLLVWSFSRNFRFSKNSPLLWLLAVVVLLLVLRHARAGRLGGDGIFGALLTFPWCFGLLAAPLQRWRELRRWAGLENGRGIYLLTWALWPMLLLLKSREFSVVCALAALPALSMLLAEILRFRTYNIFGPKGFHPLHPVMVAACGLMMVWTVADAAAHAGTPDATPCRVARVELKRPPGFGDP